MKLTIFMLGLLTISGSIQAQTMTAQEVAKQIMQRPDGQHVKRQLRMTLIDPSGNKMSREAEVWRTTDQQIRKTLIRFTGPKRIKDTAFLTFDYQLENHDDEQWMYLPALRRERRIPASDRGDHFMGSEFSYEDVKSELKFPLHDYQFSLLGQEQGYWLLQGIPVSPELADSLGFSRFVAKVDEQSWLPIQVEFWDRQDRPLKTVKVTDRALIDGFWTLKQIEVSNVQSGHASRFDYLTVEYRKDMDPKRFNVTSLRQ